jgi:hypothetical protein
MDVPKLKVTGEATSNPVTLTETIPNKSLNPNHSLCGYQRARNPLSNLQHKQRSLLLQ